jgi:hypothetical protein
MFNNSYQRRRVRREKLKRKKIKFRGGVKKASNALNFD